MATFTRSCLPAAFAFLLLAVSSTGMAKGPPAASRPMIEATNAKFIKAYQSGDMAGLAALYTEKGLLMPPGGPFVEGRKGIQEFWTGTKAAGVEVVKLNTIDVEEGGDLAYEIGTADLMIKAEGKEPQKAAGKYIVVWKRQKDGTWQLHRDIWNDLPPK
jgi:uncharacterized protein (TIGR02246 family)